MKDFIWQYFLNMINRSCYYYFLSGNAKTTYEPLLLPGPGVAGAAPGAALSSGSSLPKLKRC